MAFKFSFGDTARTLGKYKYLLLIAAAGLLLVFWPSGSKQSVPEESYAPYPLREAEREMAAALGEIAGAGSVKVVLTLQTDMTLIYQEDEKTKSENRQEGQIIQAERETETVFSGTSSSSRPLMIKRVYPEFRGALVVCQGAGDVYVRLAVTEAVAALTGLGSDRITVTTMR
ncbi:MAG: hypothetical protein LBR85_06440 [Oscillospiraceae bacterium]|nr:hypothetical protein [Oscillospiraceae bacterium]